MTEILTLGLDIDLRVAELLALIQEELSPWMEAQGAQPRWIPPTQLRLPLKVMRGVDEALLPQVQHSVDQITGALVPFKISLRGVQILPEPGIPRLLAAQVEMGAELVANLRKVLETRLELLGLPLDPRPFLPLIPLGRILTPEQTLDMSQGVAPLQALDLGTSYVRSLVLWHSDLGPERARTRVLARSVLGG